MVAYGLKSRFAEPILAGTKRQTIRAIGKRRHARPGETLQLYTGMRTKHCRLIMKAECEAVLSVVIDWLPDIPTIKIAGVRIATVRKAVDEFARSDGFRDIDEMRAFWAKEHSGVDYFEGIMIVWKSPAVAEREMMAGVIRGLP